MKKRRGANRRRECVFCGSHGPGTVITGEHLWSDWMASYLPEDPTAKRIEFMEDLESEKSMRPILIESTKPGAANKKKMRVVCATCNSGWMSIMENDTKPMLLPLITGRQSSLDAGSIQQLMQWVTLKTMVAEHDVFDGRTPMPIYDSVARRRFMDTRDIPDGIWAWIGPGGSPKWCTGFHRHVTGVRSTSAPAGSVIEPNFVRLSANIHSVTWGIGCFFVHVIATTEMKFYSRHVWEVPPGLIPIWPPNGRVVPWRPDYAFWDGAIDAMASSLREVSKTFPKIASDGTLLPP
jgi:hypothetical protein